MGLHSNFARGRSTRRSHSARTPKSAGGISKSQLYPVRCLDFLVMEADSVRLTFRLPVRRRFCSPPCERGLNGAVRPRRRKAGCNSEITGQGNNRKVKEAEALRQALMFIEERAHSKRVDAYGTLGNAARLPQRSGCPASRLIKASDVMLHRRVFQRIDAELGGVSGFDTEFIGLPSSVQSARDGRNLRLLSPYPTPYSEWPSNSSSKFCDVTEGEGGDGGTGQVHQGLLVTNCGKGAGSLCGLTSAILTEEKWWLAGEEFTSTPGCSGFCGVPRLWLPVVKRAKSALSDLLRNFLRTLIPLKTLDTVAPVDVVKFFIWKDQKGKTKVHEAGRRAGKEECKCPCGLVFKTVNT
ncbi:hypothetical protein Bbelb_270510 [Branchiostoma belcheri]|nr:hypothetical protein Bbelb_270510 [Branchiostoma belcheri]